MMFRLMVALGALALSVAASAQSPDLAAIAKSSGTPEIPGLKMVWLAPWGDVANAHPWSNIIVHQTEGPAGSARYDIPLDHVYAHNWIDYKDARYCEGCALATMAREWGQ